MEDGRAERVPGHGAHRAVSSVTKWAPRRHPFFRRLCGLLLPIPNPAPAFLAPFPPSSILLFQACFRPLRPRAETRSWPCCLLDVRLWSASLSVSFPLHGERRRRIRTLCRRGQGASLLSQRPLLVGAGQVIHRDAVVLPQRAEVDHNVLHLLAFQRDSNLRRQEKPPGGQPRSRHPVGMAKALPAWPRLPVEFHPQPPPAHIQGPCEGAQSLSPGPCTFLTLCLDSGISHFLPEQLPSLLPNPGPDVSPSLQRPLLLPLASVPTPFQSQASCARLEGGSHICHPDP